MLVLTRKYQEKIRIGNNITITVLRMKGKAVRLGIEAPAEVPVIRGELSFNESDTPEQCEVDSVGVESEVAIEFGADQDKAVRHGRTFGRLDGVSTPWPTSPVAVHEEEPTVEFTRVPREKAGKILPKLTSGHAPLRAMMFNAAAAKPMR